MRRIAVFLVFILLIISCNDDDDVTVEITPPRALAEVAAEEDVIIQEYLRTHFYNYEEFDSIPENFDFKIVIDTIAGENSDKIPLATSVVAETITVASSDLGIAEDIGGDVPVKYYTLVARQGEGVNPTVADSIFYKFEGRQLNNFLFDSNESFSWIYLPNFLRGFGIGISKLNAGGEIIENPDGTTSIENTGIGMIVFPSGLGYYNSPPFGSSISIYEPLIFKFELGLFVEDTDFDNDGIPSIMEDINGDGNVDNDNTDEDAFATGQPATNHLDSDDDNDGIETRDEIEFDEAGNLILPLPDTDGDSIPDYLDADTN